MIGQLSIGVAEVWAVLAVIVVTGTLLAYFDAPTRNRARYSGPVFDPQRPVIRRAGAVGYTGKKCELCGMTTFSNYGDRCGACGRSFAKPLVARSESTRRRTFVESK